MEESMSPFYTFDGDTVQNVTLMQYIEWITTHNTQLLYTETDDARLSVSTVFLGINHAYNNQEKPLLFETMVFGGVMDKTVKRYATRAEAHKGHMDIVKILVSEKDALTTVYPVLRSEMDDEC
jgi:hypothetical protein